MRVVCARPLVEWTYPLLALWLGVGWQGRQEAGMSLTGISATPTEPCPACNGQGFWESWAWRGRGEVFVDCWDCDATGRIPAETVDTREHALAEVERSFA